MNPHFLHSIFKPSNFKEEELSLILEQFSEVELVKNDYFIQEGKVAGYYFFLESGFARSYAVDPDGNDISTNFYTIGDIIIDWQSYFLKTPSVEYIQALSDCKAHKIHFENFMKLFDIEAFREVGRTRLVQGYFALKNHSVSMITQQAKERYKKLIDTKPEIVQNVPLKQIATYLGITDTSLSRIRKELTKNHE